MRRNTILVMHYMNEAREAGVKLLEYALKNGVDEGGNGGSVRQNEQ